MSKSDFVPPLADLKKLAAKVPAATENSTVSPPDDDDDEELDQLLNLKKPAAGNQSDPGKDEEKSVSDKGERLSWLHWGQEAVLGNLFISTPLRDSSERSLFTLHPRVLIQL